MPQTTGNTTEPSGDNTALPDTPSGMQIHEVLSKIDQHNNQVQQDLAQTRQISDRVYQVVAKLEKAAGPFAGLAVQFKQSADLLVEMARRADQQAGQFNRLAVQYREILAVTNETHLKECGAASAIILREIEEYKAAEVGTVVLMQKALADKHYENLEWLMVVESIVRPTSESD